MRSDSDAGCRVPLRTSRSWSVARIAEDMHCVPTRCAALAQRQVLSVVECVSLLLRSFLSSLIWVGLFLTYGNDVAPAVRHIASFMYLLLKVRVAGLEGSITLTLGRRRDS